MIRLLIIFLFLFSFATSADLQHDPDFVKAVYIEKISRFLTWTVEKEESSEFNLCISDNSAVEKYLPRLYNDRMIKKKHVNIIRTTDFENAIDCHILYVNKDNINEAKFLKNHAVVLIGNNDGLENMGTHINFFNEEKRVRFWINPKSYKDSGIRVNHLLLSIAKIVR